MIARTTLLACTTLLLAGCTGGAADDAAPGAATAETPTPTNRVAIPATVRRNLGITFAKVESRSVASTIRVPGSFELQPNARHEYRMVLEGRVQFEVRQYQPVVPGTLLYSFRSPQWPELQHEIITGEQTMDSARAEIQVATARLVEARRKLQSVRERIEALAAAEFRRAELETQAAELEASLPRLESELDLSEIKFSNAERTYEHAMHRAASAIGLNEEALVEYLGEGPDAPQRYEVIDWIHVHATEAGIVETLAVTDGAWVQAHALVISTVDPARVRFRAMGLQSDIPRFTGDLKARIVPPQSPGFDATDGVDAQLSLGLEAHPDQRTITLIANPYQARPWTRPGVSAFLEVMVGGSDKPALAVPRSAVVKDGLVHVFFRRDPKDANQAIRVEADLGVDDGRWVVLKSGVRAGDEVVLEGAFELKLATSQSGQLQKGGHFHADGTFHAESH
ncbi:MAG: efflux RND transporter periplasmic adaptor subunit [Planctomycetota bacterium]|jgi:multidrug efflux pump subunit AcrA (membrane-fusion protein)